MKNTGKEYGTTKGMKKYHSNKKLNICLIAPPWYSLPPNGYGGTELIVYLLYQGLIELGHKVIVIGQEESEIPVVKYGKSEWISDLNPSSDKWDRIFQYQKKITDFLLENNFDIVNDHSKPPGYNMWAKMFSNTSFIYTVHDAISDARFNTLTELKDFNVYYTGISKNQIKNRNRNLFAGIVHNAVNIPKKITEYKRDINSGYILQIGRIMSEKGQHLSIELAKKLGKKLIIAGKVDSSPEAQDYYKKYIKKEIGDGVEYIKSIAGFEKWSLITKAEATIFPLQWEEPFGLVFAESLICGTPVLAYDRGAVREIIRNEKDGFIVNDINGLINTFPKVKELNRDEIQKTALKNFSYKRMADDYLTIYKQILEV